MLAKKDPWYSRVALGKITHNITLHAKVRTVLILEISNFVWSDIEVWRSKKKDV